MKKFILFACALAAAFGLQAQKTDLRYNLEVGKEYTMIQTGKQTTSQNVMGMNVDVTNIIDSEFICKVKSFENEVYDIEMRHGKYAVETKSPYGNTSLDSEGTGTDAATKMLKALKENSFSIKMNDKGEIVEVSGYAEMIEKIVSDPSASQYEKTIMQQTAAILSPEAFESSMSTAMPPFPANPVAPGDKWTSDSTIDNSGMVMTVRTTYEYEGARDGMWVIKSNSTIGTLPGSSMTMEGVTVTYSLKGTMTSEVKYTQATGWIAENNVKQDISGTMSMDVPMQGPMDIALTLKTTMATTGK